MYDVDGNLLRKGGITDSATNWSNTLGGENSGWSLFDNIKSDGNGGQVKTQGVAGLGLGAFNAYNSWAQGNKMYDLGKEALENEKEQSWINNLMKRDAYNYERNRRTSLVKQAQGVGAGGAQTVAGDAALASDFNTGEYMIGTDGSHSNVFDAPAQYSGYNAQPGSTQFTNPSAAPADTPYKTTHPIGNSGFAVPNQPTPATQARPATQPAAGGVPQRGTPAAGTAPVRKPKQLGA